VKEVNPLFFWGVITGALTISLVLILSVADIRGGIYILLLIPIAAYLAIMGFFLMYLSRFNKERNKLLSERIFIEQNRAEEFSKLNKELSDYAKQLFDKE
jgi:sensor domain CHASE-containing protein